MNTTEITNTLLTLKKDNPDSLTAEIITEVLADKNTNPIKSLTERVGGLGIKYNLDNNFFTSFKDDIESIIDDNLERAKKYIKINQFIIDASWFAYQVTLQNILIDLNLFVEDDVLFD